MIVALALCCAAIVGGDVDNADAAVVALTVGGFPYCSGALIGAHTVLTAGHCDITALPISVATGADANNPDDTFDVVDVARDPDFTAEGADGDVMLLKLDRDPPLPAGPAALAKHGLNDGDIGKSIRHVGYGVTDQASGDGRGVKRSVTMPITRLTTTTVFSGAGGRQTCDGDSGGPGFIADDDGVERITGIVSDGPDCVADGWDMRVDAVRAFIDDTAARFERAPEPASAGASGTSGHGCGTCAQGVTGCALALLSLVGALRLRPSRRRGRS